MDKQILKPDRKPIYFLLFVSVLFVVAGVYMIKEQNSTGWLVAGFFGLGILVAVVQLMPNSSYLEVTPEGFTVKTLFRAHSLRWSDVKEFGVTDIRGAIKLVGYNFSDSYKKTPAGRYLARAVSDYEAALPETYGKMNHQALADFLNQRCQPRS